MTRWERRRESARAALNTEPIEALWVSVPASVRYLTGQDDDDSTLVLTADRAVIVSDGRYASSLGELQTPELEVHIRQIGQPMIRGVAEVVARLGVGSLGVLKTSVTLADAEGLAEHAPKASLKPTKDLIGRLRMVKDDDEVAAIRRAIESAERAFEILKADWSWDRSEKDAADEMEAAMRRCGAESAAFPPIVASGSRSALPHARPTRTGRLSEGELVLVDWGATRDAYRSDLTRVLATGNVTPAFESVYRIVQAAQERAIATIRPGVTAQAVDAAARAVIEEGGYGEQFPHGTGHGIGLDIHEAPFLRRTTETPLAAGMVLTIEPGIYLPGWGGVRIEDDVLVTPNGCEVLTSVPRGIDALRLD